jgi:hypothetical protein
MDLAPALRGRIVEGRNAKREGECLRERYAGKHAALDEPFGVE